MTDQGRFFFVRHGQTSANINREWHGSTDTALTALGHQQARQLGSWFKGFTRADVIFASPLQRAQDTARAIADAQGLEIVTDHRLGEFSLGDWEGIKFDEIETRLKAAEQLYKNPHFTAPGGESQLVVRNRMVEAIEEIVTRHRDQQVVMVSHGVAIAIAIAHYLHGDTTRWMEYQKHNTGVTEFCPRRQQLIFFNRTDHLLGR